MITLNSFLRKLPELFVDNLTFVRGRTVTNRTLKSGTWKLRKLGYNSYALDRVPSFRGDAQSWTSKPEAGDIYITRISVLFKTGVTVHLGEDVPHRRY